MYIDPTFGNFGKNSRSSMDGTGMIASTAMNVRTNVRLDTRERAREVVTCRVCGRWRRSKGKRNVGVANAIVVETHGASVCAVIATVGKLRVVVLLCRGYITIHRS